MEKQILNHLFPICCFMFFLLSTFWDLLGLRKLLAGRSQFELVGKQFDVTELPVLKSFQIIGVYNSGF